MLSVFPSLLSFQSVGPFIIRLTLGIIFILWAYKALSKPKQHTNNKVIALIEGVASILIIIGLYTQVGALILIIDLIVRLYNKFKHHHLFSDGVNYYFVLFVLALSLILTGPGFLAFDLPL
jgi:uncharacterized membrane protein YphA (DoxX/SURF4 family)